MKNKILPTHPKFTHNSQSWKKPIKKTHKLTWTKVATTNPKVNPMWTTDGSYPGLKSGIVLATPKNISKNVPRSSANNALKRIFDLLISEKPIIFERSVWKFKFVSFFKNTKTSKPTDRIQRNHYWLDWTPQWKWNETDFRYFTSAN